MDTPKTASRSVLLDTDSPAPPLDRPIRPVTEENQGGYPSNAPSCPSPPKCICPSCSGHVRKDSVTFQKLNIMAGRKETSGLRLACDGCHVRKLRCSRNAATCARCLRDGVQCVYSPARKVGRPSKAEQMASQLLDKSSDANAAEVLESLRGNPAEYSAAQQSEQEASQAAFWAQLGPEGYTHLPLEGFWSDPHDSGEEPNGGDGVDPYGNMTMTIGSEAFSNEDLTVNQSHSILSTYNDMSGTFESKLNRRASGVAIDSVSLITPPRERSDCDTEASTTVTSNKIQRLADLQQQLYEQRSHIPDPACGGYFSEVIDFDAIIGTGQAILELTRGIFTSFATVRPRADQEIPHRVGGEYDPATILIAISPSLLVVTTYNDILGLIGAALDEIGVSNLSQVTHAPPMEAFQDVHPDEAGGTSPSQHPKHNTLFHGMTLKVGKLDVDFPLRLIISMSIIEYQLGPLERSLQFLHSNHSRSQIPDISRGILTAAIDGLRCAIEEVLGKVSKLIKQAKLLDIV